MLSLKQNPDQSYQGLLKSVRKILQEKYDQKPQLASSHRIVSSPGSCRC
jgi:metacaspase-1